MFASLDLLSLLWDQKPWSTLQTFLRRDYIIQYHKHLLVLWHSTLSVGFSFFENNFVFQTLNDVFLKTHFFSAPVSITWEPWNIFDLKFWLDILFQSRCNKKQSNCANWRKKRQIWPNCLRQTISFEPETHLKTHVLCILQTRFCLRQKKIFFFKIGLKFFLSYTIRKHFEVL